MLVIDYGHDASELYGPHRMAGTLVTYRDHVAGDDPFGAVGGQDLSAHVDISALERTAAEVGLDRLAATTQARLLAGLGLGELLYQVGQAPTTSDARVPRRPGERRPVARSTPPGRRSGCSLFGREVPPEPPLRGFEDQRSAGRDCDRAGCLRRCASRPSSHG